MRRTLGRSNVAKSARSGRCCSDANTDGAQQSVGRIRSAGRGSREREFRGAAKRMRTDPRHVSDDGPETQPRVIKSVWVKIATRPILSIFRL